jgi:hypothetical protein
MENVNAQQKKYTFNYIVNCNMCGSDVARHKVLSKQLNRSQAFNKNGQLIGYEIIHTEYYVCTTYMPKVLANFIGFHAKDEHRHAIMCLVTKKRALDVYMFLNFD